MKFDSMSKFDYLLLGALILEIFAAIAGWDVIRLSLRDRALAQGATLDEYIFQRDMLAWAYALVFAVQLALWALVSLFRVAFVRYLIVILVAIDTAAMVKEKLDPSTPLFFRVISITAILMAWAAVYFVFQPDAKARLRGEA